jgi:phage gp45-like
MHRSTPAATLSRSYSSGGGRSVVHEVDDTKLMQEMKGGVLAGEKRKQVEAPQNYGFTSVTADADKGADGSITGSPETFISYIGGNRSFPVATAIDDRRHRLYKLEKGDVAMFRLRDDQQQMHLTKDGGFWSAPDDKTVRMQLVPKKQQQSGGTPTPHDGTGGGTGTSSQGQQQKGQQAVYKDGKDGDLYIDVTKDATRSSGTNVHLIAKGKGVLVHVSSDGNIYLGGKSGSGMFKKVMLSGEELSKNVYALTGGGAEPDLAARAREAKLDALIKRVEALEARERQR